MIYKKIIKDNIVKGSIAGVIAGTIMEIFLHTFYITGYMDIRPTDFSMIIIKHEKARDLLEGVIGFSHHLFFASITGVVLSYILLITKFRFPILKGIGAGLGTNIILIIFASFFNIKKVIAIKPLNILLLDLGAAISFGVIGYILYYLHKKTPNV